MIGVFFFIRQLRKCSPMNFHSRQFAKFADKIPHLLKAE